MAALQGVTCNVKDCNYWSSNRCTASSIEVDMNSGITSAKQSDQTNCQTFKPGNR
ncbi:DUF1540 domain-containing protein [Selenomonadales bacterium OttesenSCG-928-I06]|nr:DUF1540 domain-containing protein [Selenomonadales bacterium OttesenSCG-928-I06]